MITCEQRSDSGGTVETDIKCAHCELFLEYGFDESGPFYFCQADGRFPIYDSAEVNKPCQCASTLVITEHLAFVPAGETWTHRRSPSGLMDHIVDGDAENVCIISAPFMPEKRDFCESKRAARIAMIVNAPHTSRALKALLKDYTRVCAAHGEPLATPLYQEVCEIVCATWGEVGV